jgi:hypothetical protein
MHSSRRSDIRLAATLSQPPNPRDVGLSFILWGRSGSHAPVRTARFFPHSFMLSSTSYAFTCGAHGARWSPCPFPYSGITPRDSFWEIAGPTWSALLYCTVTCIIYFIPSRSGAVCDLIPQGSCNKEAIRACITMPCLIRSPYLLVQTATWWHTFSACGYHMLTSHDVFFFLLQVIPPRMTFAYHWLAWTLSLFCHTIVDKCPHGRFLQHY